MGLAGRKQKQRIPTDPRNLSWADDASRFGLSYLSKFGWDASQGLGSSGDGMKTHLKVQQKLDMMGIGAQHQRDPNGIAWKQSKDFEALLKRLNQSTEQGKGDDDKDAEEECARVRDTATSEGFVRAREELAKEPSVTKKRKHDDGDSTDANEKERKKLKKEKRQKSRPEHPTAPAANSTPEPTSALSSPKLDSELIPKSCPMAHRVRIRAAKRIAGKSASAIAEILGIVPSSESTSTSSPSSTPPASSTPPQPSVSLDNLTTSTKSVADYFREKLIARSFSSTSSPVLLSTPSGSATPGLGATIPRAGLAPLENECELPRRGIGSCAPAVPPFEPGIGLGSDNNDHDKDVLTEKQRRKAERKAEKRKRREAETDQVRPGGISATVNERMEEDDANTTETSKKEKRRKKCHARSEEPPADPSNDNDADAEKGTNATSTPSGAPRVKKKRGRKKEQT